MNRRKIVELTALFMYIVSTITALIYIVNENHKLEEILIEKENTISDMDTRLETQTSIALANQERLEALSLQHEEVLQTLSTLQTDLATAKKENETLHSQNATLAKKVSTLEANAKQAAQTAKSTPVVSRGNASGAKEFYVKATAYTAYCTGCSGKTATGIDLRANPSLKVVAVDPKVIPLGSKVWVEGYGNAIAGDTGGAIKGNKIDVFIPNQSAVKQWGVKQVKIRIIQ